jgi:hypothetical protein
VTFKKAVEASTPPLNKAYKPGLQALGDYSKKILCARRPPSKTFSGSVDADRATARIPLYAGMNRWDYGIGYKPVKGPECAIWVDVHGAKDKEVGTLARKAKWLKEYLKQNAPELWKMTLNSPEELRFIWLGTKSVHLLKNSPEYRRAKQEGIFLHGTVLSLP